MATPPARVKADPFRALAHPLRLLAAGPSRVRELLTRAEAEHSCLSQQLPTPRGAGVVTRSEQARRRLPRLAEANHGVQQIAELTQPEPISWCDDSPAERARRCAP